MKTRERFQKIIRELQSHIHTYDRDYHRTGNDWYRRQRDRAIQQIHELKHWVIYCEKNR